MNPGDDEELNYEEDDLENDELCKESQNGECTQDTVKNNINQDGEDQYLQIDYLEDEDLTDGEVPVENVTNNPESAGKEMEKNENSNQENVPSAQKGVSCCRKSDNNIGTTPKTIGSTAKRKKPLRPFQHKVEVKRNLRKSHCLNPWLPEYNFADQQNFVRSPPFNPKREFYPIPSSPLPPLMPNSERYLQSPSPGLGIGLSSLSFPQQSNNLTVNLLGLPLNGGMTPDTFSRGCNINNSSVFNQKNFNNINRPYCGSFQSNNSRQNGYKPVFYKGNATAVTAAFKDQQPRCYPVERENPFVSNVQYKPLQEEEKKVLMKKKEARLKRFMQDDLIKKDKSTESGFKEYSQSSPKVQLFEKKEEKCVIEEKPKNLVTGGPPFKLDINKELLLRKKNPFIGNAGTSNSDPATKANQTEKVNGVKVEGVDTKVREEPMKTEAQAAAPDQGFAPVKREMESQVKFFRTVSKSFGELTFKKPKTEVPEPQGKLFPSAGLKIGESLPKQLEPQLTGSIVKVLNIPPSTTTNDILALCSPIGIVMEIKLNCPKENSVVIRFAEPKFADQFFNLYHGRKMNNYFLNVIVV